MEQISSKNASSKAIFEHLCDQMGKLNYKLISIDEAKAQASLAKQANNVMRYELDIALAKTKFGDKFKFDDPKR